MRHGHLTGDVQIYVSQSLLGGTTLDSLSAIKSVVLFNSSDPETVAAHTQNFDLVLHAVCVAQNKATEKMRIQTETKFTIAVVLYVLLSINLFGCFSNALSERQFEIGVKRAIGASPNVHYWSIPHGEFDRDVTGKTLKAIAEYILEERPKSEDKHIFLRSSPPYGAITTTTPLDYMVDKYCRLASIDKIKYRSFHSLRRAFGTELAVAEIPVTAISQMLGHKDMGASKAYLSFNNTQTSMCASVFSEVPITNGICALQCQASRTSPKKGGNQA